MSSKSVVKPSWPVPTEPPCGSQSSRVVVDPDRLESPTRIVAGRDHAAPPVQFDADILFLLFHGSLVLSLPGWFRKPKCAPHTCLRATVGLPSDLRR